jgi:hypothetical protein
MMAEIFMVRLEAAARAAKEAAITNSRFVPITLAAASLGRLATHSRVPWSNKTNVWQTVTSPVPGAKLHTEAVCTPVTPVVQIGAVSAGSSHA